MKYHQVFWLGLESTSNKSCRIATWTSIRRVWNCVKSTQYIQYISTSKYHQTLHKKTIGYLARFSTLLIPFCSIAILPSTHCLFTPKESKSVGPKAKISLEMSQILSLWVFLYTYIKNVWAKTSTFAIILIFFIVTSKEIILYKVKNGKVPKLYSN